MDTRQGAMGTSSNGFYVNWHSSEPTQYEEHFFSRKKWLANIYEKVTKDEGDNLLGVVISTYCLSLASLKEDVPWIFAPSLDGKIVPAFVMHGERESNIHTWMSSDGNRYAKKGMPPSHLIPQNGRALDDLIHMDTDDEKDEEVELVDYEELRAEPNITYLLPDSLRLTEVLPQFPRFISSGKGNDHKKLKISRPCIRVSNVNITCTLLGVPTLIFLTDFSFSYDTF